MSACSTNFSFLSHFVLLRECIREKSQETENVPRNVTFLVDGFPKILWLGGRDKVENHMFGFSSFLVTPGLYAPSEFSLLSFHRGTRNKLCNYVFPLDWCFDRYIAYSSSSADLCHLCARNCVRENMDFFCETKLKFETFRSIACGLIHFKDFTNLRVLNSKRYLPNTFLFPSKFHKRSDIETPTRTHVKSPLFVQYACVSWTRKWWCWSSLCGSVLMFFLQGFL